MQFFDIKILKRVFVAALKLFLHSRVFGCCVYNRRCGDRHAEALKQQQNIALKVIT